MHVLSLPPAFVLSQDQTLKLKSSISTKSLRKLTEFLPPRVSPEKRYSPKHRQSRCLVLDRPEGQSAIMRSPQGHRRPRFSFFLHLSKSRSRQRRRQTSHQPAAQGAGFWRGRPPVRQNRAVDEAYLANPAPSVNTKLEEICSFFDVSFKAPGVEAKKERSQKQHCFCVVLARAAKNHPVTFEMGARGATRRRNTSRFKGSCVKPEGKHLT